MRLLLLFTVIIFILSSCEKILIGPGPGNTAADNFDILWRTIDEKYGLFPVSDVNWDSLYEVYYDQIVPATTETQLWTICCNLLSHLQNGHVMLVDYNHSRYYSADSPSEETYAGMSIGMIKNNYLNNPLVTGESFITYGKIKNTTLGYISFSSFYYAVNGRDWIRDLDNVISYLKDCEGMIIDVRNNGGGYAKNNDYAASAFIDRDVIYYYSQQKTGTGHNDFGDPIAKVIHTRKDTLKYIRKNAVLTNGATASGAEAFALALRNLPYSVQIGDTTLGAIGEVTHVAQLPNGWVLYYPCTLSLYPDGTSPENIGVIPDILINNSPEDIEAGRDIVLERAIEYLVQ